MTLYYFHISTEIDKDPPTVGTDRRFIFDATQPKDMARSLFHAVEASNPSQARSRIEGLFDIWGYKRYQIDYIGTHGVWRGCHNPRDPAIPKGSPVLRRSDVDEDEE